MGGSVVAADSGPGLVRRAGFWVLLGVASAVFAEVLFRRSRPSASGLDPEGEGRTPQ